MFIFIFCNGLKGGGGADKENKVPLYLKIMLSLDDLFLDAWSMSYSTWNLERAFSSLIILVIVSSRWFAVLNLPLGTHR